MERSRKAQLTEGSVAAVLVRLTLPMILGVVSMVAFNLVDTYFVGQLGTNQLAAMSFTFPVVLVIASLAQGLGVGASAAISRAIGEGDSYRVKRLTTDSLMLALIVVIFFVVIGLMTIDPLFTLLGATAEILPLIRDYMTIWYIALMFVVVPMIGNNAIRATGDTKTPSVIMMVAVFTNFVLDPLLIFGWGPIPAFGLKGAAAATAISRATTLLVSLWVLYFREEMLTFEIPALKTAVESWKQILYIGLPAAGTNILVPVSTGVITGMVASYGPAAVAALGVAARLETFSVIIVLALQMVIAPFVGQNWGAGRFDRVKQGVNYAFGFAMAWGAFMFVLWLLIARPVAGLFNDNPEVIETIGLYLRLVPLSYGAYGVIMLAGATLNVLNKPFHATAVNVVRLFILYIPLAYAASRLFGIEGIFGAATLANLVAGTLAFVLVRRFVALPEPALEPDVIVTAVGD